MDLVLDLIGREEELFSEDIQANEETLSKLVSNASFLVIGGAGTIGQAVSREIFRRDPRVLHVVDLSENNLVELVRDLRSSLGHIDGDFRTFALDAGSAIYDAFVQAQGRYDYVLNLSALKHVRSEKDPYTLMRMVETNIENTEKTLRQSIESGVSKYFCVSTDKATNPVSMMGASKRIMEQVLMGQSPRILVSTARFANVAFSDGSLLHGFNQRIHKHQPLAAPYDIKRYFLTPKESGELCLMSCLLGDNRDTFFPKLNEKLHLIGFDEIARRYLLRLGYEAVACETEVAARASVEHLIRDKKWPCHFAPSNTSGEKDFEEFFCDQDTLKLDRFTNVGVIKNKAVFDQAALERFLETIQQMKNQGDWTRAELVSLFQAMVPEFEHQDTGRYLDSKM